MKRLLVLILSILLIPCLVSCTAEEALSKPEDELMSSEPDYDEFLLNYPDPTEQITADREDGLILPEYATNYDDIDIMMAESDYVLIGAITGLEYINGEDSHVYTKATFKVFESFKGDRISGDDISVALFGGKTTLDTKWDLIKDHLESGMTKEKASEITILEYYGSKSTLLRENDKLIIFGRSYDGSVQALDGSISPIGSVQTVFCIDSSGTVKRYCDDNMEMTLDEMLGVLK